LMEWRNIFYGMKKTTEIPLFRDLKLRNFSLLQNGISIKIEKLK
jgi:hypothetical protein